ncbi:MAG: hypothetical protein V1707_01600 [bacterium]
MRLAYQIPQREQLVMLTARDEEAWLAKTSLLPLPDKVKVYVSKRNNHYCLQFSQRRDINYTYYSYYEDSLEQLIVVLQHLVQPALLSPAA